MVCYLTQLNSHELDKHITFDEEPHIYTIDGDSDYISVTTWVHTFFRHFDADAIIDKMMKSRNWTNSKYYGKTKEEIKQSWDENCQQASKSGTRMHYLIEVFYNELLQQLPNIPTIDCDSIEIEYFKRFYNDHSHLTPYRTEWIIYDKELKIAGSIDMVYKESDGSLSIYDWKRSKEIKRNTNFNEYMLHESINYIPDTNYWHYCLQLNVYKALLEKNYGVKIKDLYLVRLHPDNDNKSYEKIQVVELQEEVSILFSMRINELKNSDK